MIRFRRLTPDLLNLWLVDQGVASAHSRYRLRLWHEDQAGLAALREELVAYIDEGFEDARARIRRGFVDDLSPFDDPRQDPAANYPAFLNKVTLQGYFGETLAVIAIEHWGAHGYTDWHVPAFLFRFHDQEFQHLDLINERISAGEPFDPDASGEKRPGRTGDDGIAFRFDAATNTITDILTLEAKCLTQSNEATIVDAHQKLAKAGRRPSGIRELINLLDEYDTPLARAWQEALLKLWSGGYNIATRRDGLSYACGNSPIRGGRQSWMPATAPHSSYTNTRALEGMEFHFKDIPAIVSTFYRKGTDGQ